MAKHKSQDLFDDKTMSFGEHLEELRKHLVLALLGLAVTVILSLFFSNYVMDIIQIPGRAALRRFHAPPMATPEVSFWESLQAWWNGKPDPNTVQAEAEARPLDPSLLVPMLVDGNALLRSLHKLEPKIPAPADDAPQRIITLQIRKQDISDNSAGAVLNDSLVATTMEEPFMVYLQVALWTGIILAFPWLFYQLWLFVSAGLYPHEKKYVYIYMPLGLFLFFTGTVFCFFAVIPYVLDFLLGFNKWLGIAPVIKLSDYISLAITLPVMFGISFQLPIVMLMLERVSILPVEMYRSKRKLAILAIAFISMVLTPSDPISMLLMMVPLVVLYEVGIWLCLWKPHAASPFESEAGAG